MIPVANFWITVVFVMINSGWCFYCVGHARAKSRYYRPIPREKRWMDL